MPFTIVSIRRIIFSSNIEAMDLPIVFGNKLDVSNLIITSQLRTLNSALYFFFSSKRQQWKVQVVSEGKSKYCSYFDSEEDAKNARDTQDQKILQKSSD